MVCFKNGRRIIIPLEQAYKLFWKSEFSWLWPMDWYRFKIDQFEGQSYVTKKAGRAARVLGYFLHRRGYRALSVDRFCELDCKSKFIGRDAFYARMAKFNRLFGKMPTKLRPFEFFEVIPDDHRPQPGYRLKPGREIFMIHSLEPDSGFSGEDIDWTIFQRPPCTR